MGSIGYVMAVPWLRAEASSGRAGRPARPGRTARAVPVPPLPPPARPPAVGALAAAQMRFLNMAAHELNTPLTPLRLQVHLLRSGAFGKANAKQRKAIAIMARNLERL